MTLRRWLPQDMPILRDAVHANIEHLRPWMPWIAFEPMSDDDRKDLIRSWQTDWAAGGDVVLGAFADATLVGGCGLHRRAGPKTLGIGYWVHVNHLRNGYASEIALALQHSVLYPRHNPSRDPPRQSQYSQRGHPQSTRLQLRRRVAGPDQGTRRGRSRPGLVRHFRVLETNPSGQIAQTRLAY